MTSLLHDNESKEHYRQLLGNVAKDTAGTMTSKKIVFAYQKSVKETTCLGGEVQRYLGRSSKVLELPGKANVFQISSI